MAINPFVAAIAPYLIQGKEIKAVFVDNRNHPTGIVILFTDGKTRQLKIATKNRSEFTKLFTAAKTWMRFSWRTSATAAMPAAVKRAATKKAAKKTVGKKKVRKKTSGNGG